jgi:hypothetical protein
MFAPPICRRSRRNASKAKFSFDTVVSSDATKTAALQRTSQRAQRAIRHSELGERSNYNRLAALAVLRRREQTRFIVCERRRSRRARRRETRGASLASGAITIVSLGYDFWNNFGSGDSADAQK